MPHWRREDDLSGLGTSLHKLQVQRDWMCFAWILGDANSLLYLSGITESLYDNACWAFHGIYFGFKTLCNRPAATCRNSNIFVECHYFLDGYDYLYLPNTSLAGIIFFSLWFEQFLSVPWATWNLQSTVNILFWHFFQMFSGFSKTLSSEGSTTMECRFWSQTCLPWSFCS